ncbi:MAG: prepilin-type N-terminal cleavage/methylation domain-containing protein, partial [Deltaproteobacteria bacterium]|nr:prepilin-type N-terminal cleavage/methylation domain-containing protein [Deltaproteobacteria bacterium]
MNKGMRNERGFTLIELSIVLVIIGIIIGAVLKGQDLIQNARNKKFINDVKKWEIALWAYED